MVWQEGMPSSHHSHSGQFCKHAVGSLEEVVLEAIRQGFETYSLTEHVPRYRSEDLYPEENGLALQELATQFDDFVTEATRVRHLYADQINLLVGLETEYISRGDLDGLAEVLDRYKDSIDHIVGSIHHVNGIPIDFDKDTFDRCLASIPAPLDREGDMEHRRQEAYLELYFDAQYEVLQRFHPEVVGHLDLCRLYTPSVHLPDYPSAWEKLERNIKFGIEYGALFEANASALRKGWDASYPGYEVLKLILYHGGRIALSDDSHGPHAVGLNYGRMRQYLMRAGVEEIWVLERTEERNAGGRRTAPVRVRGDWWDHGFWAGREDSAVKA
ncbi:Polymerase/histidinol phosphatase-like protein [Amylostereum chailletii]|nr:Polymerase/histidinol phosphatase-like protein [Amylostereum chailletii]